MPEDDLGSSQMADSKKYFALKNNHLQRGSVLGQITLQDS